KSSSLHCGYARMCLSVLPLLSARIGVIRGEIRFRFAQKATGCLRYVIGVPFRSRSTSFAARKETTVRFTDGLGRPSYGARANGTGSTTRPKPDQTPLFAAFTAERLKLLTALGSVPPSAKKLPPRFTPALPSAATGSSTTATSCGEYGPGAKRSLLTES